MVKTLFFSIVMVVVFGNAAAQTIVQPSVDCHREEVGIYLDITVRVCLQTDGAGIKGTSSDVPVVTKALQTVTNNGKQRMYLLIFENYFNSAAVIINSSDGMLSRELPAPRMHDSTYQPPRRLSFPIDAGQSITFLYRFSDFLVKRPELNRLYTISMGCRFDFRYETETSLEARNRFQEAKGRDQNCLILSFENIRLK